MPDTFLNQPNLRAVQPQQPHESVDPISHNDRNEYLQTGHLSEDGELSSFNNDSASNAESQAQYNANDGNGDSLPPPGLSRLVLGEPETNESNDNSIQPPPGLDRLILGTEINRASDISLDQNNIFDRQADGQDNSEVPLIRSNPLSPSTPSVQSLENQGFENIDMPVSESDRNQYLVAGENTPSSSIPQPILVPNPILPAANIERVVTGVENVENQDIIAQRELVMDGENLEDEQQQQQQIQPRHSVSNVRDEEPIGAANSNLTQSDSIEELNAPSSHKAHSNASTGNDDSDREKPIAYSRNKGSSGRRSEERHKKRDNDNRYETEDTDHSVRERRRPKDERRGKDERYADKDRSYRGRSVDIDENDSRAFERRDARRGDKHFRPPSRDDEERFDDRRRYRDDKYNRYETDGSRYETEDPRYDRRRRRDDRDRDFARYDRADRQERYYRDGGRENRDGRGKLK